ncbi:hypothetical protein BG004_006971 [Podila humilis]|nr:hypothetical protein BG004_006971 [Podila humilis]
MYWRFGHQTASVIDHILENGNVSLEELLEQDDLIQECKQQNPRLIEYLRDPAVLGQLLGYITSDDLEDRARFKYPFVACEVIACELWGIFESALNNIEILIKFWEFLDRPPPLNPVQASYFGKVIGVFLMKKTGEMLQFIRSQPEVVPKLLLHMSTSSIMDLLLKIISMEESPEGKGTVQWLNEQGLMPWLVNRLDPNFDAEVHSIASQVLLDIIAISQSSHPEQPSIGTNVLIDELKSEAIVTQLVGFMLERDAPYSSSTLINGVTIFIELIRRNNSDYDVEPLPPNSTEPIREAVDLSDLLKVLASRIEDFRDLLVVPRSVTGPIETSIGQQTPLGFERLKICEMFAELLHCSNMAVLNSRPIISVSADGTVRIPCVSSHSLDHDNVLLESASAPDTPKANGNYNKAAEKSSNVQDAKENGSTSGPRKENPSTSVTDDQITPRGSPPLGPTSTLASASIASSTIATLTSSYSVGQDEVLIPVGDFLKLQFVDHRIIPTCFDLFFQFPWNNFLHTVVYDMVHQVFHRPMGDIGRPDANGTYIPPKGDQGIKEGWNRRLTISIFKDGQLTKRITDAQRLCDYECAQPKGVRLGYMGHLTYIADETVRLLELYSQTSLLSTLYEYIDLEDWWNYVSKILKETKERDAMVLGGSRPNVIESHKSSLDNDNDDYLDDNDEFGDDNGFMGGDSGTGHEGDVASDQFARYLCQQITNNLPDKFGSSDEDEDEDESNWIGDYGADPAAAGLGNPFGGDHAPDFDSDEDEDVADEETWNGPWPANLGEAKPTDSTSQSSTALSEISGDASEGALTDTKNEDAPSAPATRAPANTTPTTPTTTTTATATTTATTTTTHPTTTTADTAGTSTTTTGPNAATTFPGSTTVASNLTDSITPAHANTPGQSDDVVHVVTVPTTPSATSTINATANPVSSTPNSNSSTPVSTGPQESTSSSQTSTPSPSLSQSSTLEFTATTTVPTDMPSPKPSAAHKDSVENKRNTPEPRLTVTPPMITPISTAATTTADSVPADKKDPSNTKTTEAIETKKDTDDDVAKRINDMGLGKK